MLQVLRQHFQIVPQAELILGDETFDLLNNNSSLNRSLMIQISQE